jgi:hypothetical protein
MGLPAPVPVCEVVWEPEATLTGPLTAALAGIVGTGAFVGRRDERTTLDALWQRARDGQRQLVLVTGDPAIGKTRLASELARSIPSGRPLPPAQVPCGCAFRSGNRGSKLDAHDTSAVRLRVHGSRVNASRCDGRTMLKCRRSKVATSCS